MARTQYAQQYAQYILSQVRVESKLLLSCGRLVGNLISRMTDVWYDNFWLVQTFYTMANVLQQELMTDSDTSPPQVQVLVNML
jgi:hypothetical protein